MGEEEIFSEVATITGLEPRKGKYGEFLALALDPGGPANCFASHKWLHEPLREALNDQRTVVLEIQLRGTYRNVVGMEGVAPPEKERKEVRDDHIVPETHGKAKNEVPQVAKPAGFAAAEASTTALYSISKDDRSLRADALSAAVALTSGPHAGVHTRNFEPCLKACEAYLFAGTPFGVDPIAGNVVRVKEGN